MAGKFICSTQGTNKKTVTLTVVLSILCIAMGIFSKKELEIWKVR